MYFEFFSNWAGLDKCLGFKGLQVESLRLNTPYTGEAGECLRTKGATVPEEYHSSTSISIIKSTLSRQPQSQPRIPLTLNP